MPDSNTGPLPCPLCGYDMRPTFEARSALLRTILRSASTRIHSTDCASCRARLTHHDGLSADGVGPERLEVAEAQA